MSQTLILLLLAVPLVAAAVSWLARPPVVLYAVAAVAQVVVLALALTLLAQVVGGAEPHAFGHWLALDHLGGVVLLIVATVGLTSSVYSIGYLHHELTERAVRGEELRRYFALLHLFLFTMLLSALAGNLGLLWTAIAGTTIASAPLVDFYGSREPLEAAWKYIVLTTAGSMVALVGYLVLYQAGVHVLGISYDFSFSALSAVAPRLPAAAAVTAFLLVLVGFGAKAGLAPMHTWLPDAHSQAPSPICALLSGVELNCAMLGILRAFALTAPAAGAERLRLALLAFGVLSMLVAVVFLVSQQDFKRLLAYSSIEQMGLVAVGVGTGVPLAVFGAMLQMVNHAFGKSLMFFATGNLLLRFRTRAIGSVTGLVRDMPATAILLVPGVLALAGAPPFNVFVSEFAIVSGAAAAHQLAPALIVAALLVVGFLALVWPFNRMAFGAAPGGAGGHRATVNPMALLPAYLSLTVVVGLGFWVPSPLQALLSGAARTLTP
ncbi:MAG TPA: proton-conducting transporter membrane subunit [Candidatus Dormibacteraeota bacterium]|jgi:hydrogenase-4 component F|nr:proton-conducting transporter membrane subunit [Candidatus Dormibacteraeota bacterium]